MPGAVVEAPVQSISEMAIKFKLLFPETCAGGHSAFFSVPRTAFNWHHTVSPWQRFNSPPSKDSLRNKPQGKGITAASKLSQMRSKT